MTNSVHNNNRLLLRDDAVTSISGSQGRIYLIIENITQSEKKHQEIFAKVSVVAKVNKQLRCRCCFVMQIVQVVMKIEIGVL